MSHEQSGNGEGPPDHPLKLAHDLVELGAVYGRLARVMRRLSDRVPAVDGAGAAELDFILAEARGLDERARTIWEEKLEPALAANAARFNAGRPPWPD